jgi:BASS family bile acid:Na+ symporter
VLVPLAALAIILVLNPAPAVAIGLAILVSCPPAPVMVASAPKKGHASAAFMASLHLSLALLAFFTVPLLLWVLSGPLGFSASVDRGAMSWTLARTILIPLSLGLIARAIFSRIDDGVAITLAKIGNLGLMLVVLVAFAGLYPTLMGIGPWSYLVVATVSVAALAIGHLLGPTDPREKTTLAIECGVRHPALALSIASMNFGAPKALPVLVPCVLTFIIIASIYLAIRRKNFAATQ